MEEILCDATHPIIDDVTHLSNALVEIAPKASVVELDLGSTTIAILRAADRDLLSPKT